MPWRRSRPPGGAFRGDLQEEYGGTGVTFSVSIRAQRPAKGTRLELFARKVVQWSFDGLPTATGEWHRVATAIRYDWSDEEAIAAGWCPAAHAFSWQETIRHVGQIVVAPHVEVGSSFDLDDLTLETALE
jgi:hypothetical protein